MYFKTGHRKENSISEMVTGKKNVSQIWSPEKNYISLLCLQNCRDKSGFRFQVKVIITILHLLWRNVRGLAIVTAAKFYVKDVFELEDNDVIVFDIDQKTMP